MNKSDKTRWSKIKNFDEAWDERTIQMASYISPDSRVLEFGAGRLILKDHLPKGCTYTPSDIVDRGHGTIVCDLNKRPFPEFDKFDYIVFSGVVEYINDLDEVIDYLVKVSPKIIVSYATREAFPKYRGIHGWVNEYSKEEFIKLFNRHGYELIKSAAWKKQDIFMFSLP